MQGFTLVRVLSLVFKSWVIVLPCRNARRLVAQRRFSFEEYAGLTNKVGRGNQSSVSTFVISMFSESLRFACDSFLVSSFSTILVVLFLTL